MATRQPHRRHRPGPSPSPHAWARLRDNETGCPGYVAEGGDVAKWTATREPLATGQGQAGTYAIEEEVLKRDGGARKSPRSPVDRRIPARARARAFPSCKRAPGVAVVRYAKDVRQVGRRVERPRVRACGGLHSGSLA
jgi:hypothetical protein